MSKENLRLVGLLLLVGGAGFAVFYGWDFLNVLFSDAAFTSGYFNALFGKLFFAIIGIVVALIGYKIIKD